ncbi:hypothetical protein Ait01nite_081840 [Actinoplanes italicus]|nr:hypothetical protein Ait01nite_081840 [Actinoplanes italicus]
MGAGAAVTGAAGTASMAPVSPTQAAARTHRLRERVVTFLHLRHHRRRHRSMTPPGHYAGSGADRATRPSGRAPAYPRLLMFLIEWVTLNKPY